MVKIKVQANRFTPQYHKIYGQQHITAIIIIEITITSYHFTIYNMNLKNTLKCTAL